MASKHAPTGAERSLALLAKGLRRRGHRVCVVVPGPWSLEKEMQEVAVEVHSIHSRPCWLTYWEPRPWPVVAWKYTRYAWSLSAVSRLAEFVTSWGADVVYVNCLPHLHGAAAAHACGKPALWHLREILPAGARRRWLARHLRRYGCHLVTVSKAVAGWVREEMPGTDLDVIPNGIEIPDQPLEAAAARRVLELPRDGVFIGLIGQLAPHKGVMAFLEAASMAMKRSPVLRFLLCGDGSGAFLRRIRQEIANTQCSDRYHLLPPRPSGEYPVAACDIVCLPTLTPDPFPRSVLEAMAASRPVVAFRTGGVGEMIDDGKTGLLVEIGDSEALAQAMIRLAGDPQLRGRIAHEGLRKVRERFTLDHHLNLMEAALLATIVRSRCSVPPDPNVSDTPE